MNTSRRVLLQMAQGITLTETEHVVSDALLVSSDSAYSKPEGYEMTTTEKADGDIAGPFTLAAYARNEDTVPRSSGSTAAIWTMRASIRSFRAM